MEHDPEGVAVHEQEDGMPGEGVDDVSEIYYEQRTGALAQSSSRTSGGCWRTARSGVAGAQLLLAAGGAQADYPVEIMDNQAVPL